MKEGEIGEILLDCLVWPSHSSYDLFLFGSSDSKLHNVKNCFKKIPSDTEYYERKNRRFWQHLYKNLVFIYLVGYLFLNKVELERNEAKET